MKTFLVQIYGRFEEFNVVKAETSRQALNNIINKWVEEPGLSMMLSNYRIVENSDTTIKFVHNEDETKYIAFTIFGNEDIEAMIGELHDNEIKFINFSMRGDENEPSRI